MNTRPSLSTPLLEGIPRRSRPIREAEMELSARIRKKSWGTGRGSAAPRRKDGTAERLTDREPRENVPARMRKVGPPYHRRERPKGHGRQSFGEGLHARPAKMRRGNRQSYAPVAGLRPCGAAG